MTARRDNLRAMLTQRSEKLAVANTENVGPVPTPVSDDPTPRHMSAGVVGAMRSQLSNMVRAAEDAQAKLASGDHAFEVDPNRIEDSFIKDRLGSDDDAFGELMELIKEHGQQVPVLLRPHPSRTGWYQIAFGHRRVRALRELGRPVRAFVRTLSDEELVVAQGQENSAREDLTYIEQARFAVALEDRGFDRAVIMAALAVDKGSLSRLITIGRGVPVELVEAIGPAPKAGRPRWVELTERLSAGCSVDKWQKVMREGSFKSAKSDERFRMVFAELAPPKETVRATTETINRGDGKKLARVKRSGAEVAVIMDGSAGAAFGEFVASQIGALYEAFERQRVESVGADA